MPSVYLIACVATKAAEPRVARHLFVSPWFRKAKAFVERTGARWFVLSAKHGLVGPDRVLAPYDLTLNRMSGAERQSWAERVWNELQPVLRPEDDVVFLAGRRYRDGLVPRLRAAGHGVHIPLKGMGIGRQMRWLAARGPDSGAPVGEGTVVETRSGADVVVREIGEVGPFVARWPEETEPFDRAWDLEVETSHGLLKVRHGVGRRVVYGRSRVHTVTWLRGQPIVEGVGADDYPQTGALLCALKGPDGRLLRDPAEVPGGYEAFQIVQHDQEIRAPFTRHALAAKIRADDIAAWARLAFLRARDLGRLPGAPRRRASSERTPEPRSSRSDAAEPQGPPSAAQGLALRLTQAFEEGALDLSARPGAPAVGWTGMPEGVLAERILRSGASLATVRVAMTLVAALDRARDATRLWDGAVRAYEAAPWIFDPQAVVGRAHHDLLGVLQRHGVSQRHNVDAGAWRTIAESLAAPDRAPEVCRAVFQGEGDASTLRQALEARAPAGSNLFPFLKGPKVGRMWVRLLVLPGEAKITGLEDLEVAVDVQVRKVSEYLGVTQTRGQGLEQARAAIHEAWQVDVRTHGAAGPESLKGTCAALDPVLWFFGKWGCTFCERRRQRIPVSPVCGACRYEPREASR